MKMSGIRMLGLATLVAGGIGLTSCNMEKNEQIVKDSGISVNGFDSLKKINDQGNTWRVCENWQKSADSVVWSKKLLKEKKLSYNAGKQFVLDSLTKASKRIKP